MESTYTDKPICLRPGGIAKCYSISRATVYNLDKKYHLIHKLGSCSIIYVKEFEDVLRKETEKQA